ncbi:MAG: class I SAM-dependent methyltransferase [Candidatus Saccharibacteria bacterium]|nr:class I SAM-dependent methyltransferase [Candidatus Saccharibacteria bacterium]
MNDDNIKKLYNDGERLIPFVSHEQGELTRHFSSHNFFREIIKKDVKSLKNKNLSVLDVGFGTGYACYLYSKIDEVKTVKGIDNSEECLEWALNNYWNSKINYEVCDAVKYFERNEKYSYIVTRHVLEHIKNGLNIIDENKFSNRLCINVPYDEKEENKFHLLKGITEKDFPKYKNVEFFYEDRSGITYDKIPEGIFINSIVCIASKEGMPKVGKYFKFPYDAPTIEEITEELGSGNLKMLANVINIQKEEIADIKKSIEESEERLRQKKAEIVDLRAEIVDLKKEVQGIVTSTSWKITKPLRSLNHQISTNKNKGE